VTKGRGFCISPPRFPDRHLDVSPQIAALPLFLRGHRRRLSLPRPSPTRGSSPTRRPSLTRRSSPTRHSSPTRAHRRLPSPASSAAPTSALTDAHLPDTAPLPQPSSSAAAPSPSPRWLSSIPAAGMPHRRRRRRHLRAHQCGLRPACCARMVGRAALGFGLADVIP
jgi:hypothetical protein